MVVKPSAKLEEPWHRYNTNFKVFWTRSLLLSVFTTDLRPIIISPSLHLSNYRTTTLYFFYILAHHLGALHAFFYVRITFDLHRHLFAFRLLPPNDRMLPANHSLLPPNDGLLPPNDKTLRMCKSKVPTMKKKGGCLHLKNKECTVFHRFAESLSTHKFIEIQGKDSPKQGDIGAQGAQLSYNGDRLYHTLNPIDGGP